MLHLLQPLSTSIQSRPSTTPRRDDHSTAMTAPVPSPRPAPDDLAPLSVPRPAYASRSPRPSPLALSPAPLPAPQPRTASPLSAARHSYFFSSARQPSPAGSPALPVRSLRSDSPRIENRGTRGSWSSSTLEDVLAPGDLVGEGLTLQGEAIRLVPLGPAASYPPRAADYVAPAREFEVVKRLGCGSYAVVYHVREVLSRAAPSEDDHGATLGRLELDECPSRRRSIEYGREYAIKCLSKADHDEDALAAQMAEVTIHQSLPEHANIVTLHRTLETSAFLLLLLEFVPGEDLFYFLEQSRDHCEPAPSDPSAPSRTPPTPGLLSSLHPDQLLSRHRLRLIASMFAQMCDAVGTCHDRSVFHRDIKPENFIVTDGWVDVDGRTERKVIVKLSDFGLSTTDVDSADMDCGSAPYMSYECRNNIAPTYKPRAADVWSLGIVLINMLYHYNPWTDTTDGACHSFALFRQQPVNFFMQRFPGMTLPVAEFLANKVFCIPEDPLADPPRVTAREFGAWVRDLPALLGPSHSHRRMPSMGSIGGHPISSTAPNSRPASRHASSSRPALRLPLATAPSFALPEEAGLITDVLREPELSPVIDERPEIELEDDGRESRSQSVKRRKRGARKGKSSAVATTPDSAADTLAESLALASQQLARELSRTAVGSPASPTIDLPPIPPSVASVGARDAAPAPPAMTKKPSKWKLSFGKPSGDRAKDGQSPTESAAPEVPPLPPMPPKAQGLANNVTSIIMGLDAPAPTLAPPPPPPPPPPAAPSRSKSKSVVELNRGRRTGNRSPVSLYSFGTFDTPPTAKRQSPQVHEAWPPVGGRGRGSSPMSARSHGRPQQQPATVASSASSTYSDNWRSSMSSAASSTSAFTRYSNGSRQSVSTVATSVSAGSWRTNASKPASVGGASSSSSSSSSRGRASALGPVGGVDVPPRNVKIMDGIPWALTQLPRGMYHDPEGYVFDQPPVPRKQRTRKQPGSPLNPIREDASRSPVGTQHDAGPSSASLESDEDGAPVSPGADGPKKVQKGQIHALAKMLSALRR